MPCKALQRSIAIALLLAPTLRAQTPSPNADILKMLQAGLPESTIVNKIHSGAGHWDTSVDALIALKQAGATASELDALTAPAAAPAPQSAAPAPAPPPVDLGVPVLGGRVTNHAGLVTFSIPSSHDPGALVLNFEVVLDQGKPALKLPTEAVDVKGSVYRGGWQVSYGDLLFTHDHVTYYPYIDAGSGYGNAFPHWILTTIPAPVQFDPTQIAPFYPKSNDVPLSEDYAYIPAKSTFDYRDFWQPTHLLPKDPWGFKLGEAYARSASAADAHSCLDAILKNFDATITQILQAAGISDPDKQLGPASHAWRPTPEQLTQIAAQRNAEIEQRQKAFATVRKNAPPSDSSGSGFLAFANAMQGVANMKQAQQQANIAAANHDVAGQLQAAVNFGNAEIGTINGVTNPTAPLQPATSGGTALSSAITAQSAASTAGSSYSGPNSQFVTKLLSSASYSCNPLKYPPVPSTFVCADIDGDFYKARAIAVAIECYSEKGDTAQANQLSAVMYQTLQQAGQSCSRATNNPQCSTFPMLSCSQLPR